MISNASDKFYDITVEFCVTTRKLFCGSSGTFDVNLGNTRDDDRSYFKENTGRSRCPVRCVKNDFPLRCALTIPCSPFALKQRAGRKMDVREPHVTSIRWVLQLIRSAGYLRSHQSSFEYISDTEHAQLANRHFHVSKVDNHFLMPPFFYVSRSRCITKNSFIIRSHVIVELVSHIRLKYSRV